MATPTRTFKQTRQPTFEERQRANEERLREIGAGAYTPKTQTEPNKNRFEAVASSKTGGVIFRDTQNKGFYTEGKAIESTVEYAPDNSQTVQTTYEVRSSPFAQKQKQTPVPFQNPAIPASQVDGKASYIFTRLKEQQPQNVLESAGRFVGRAGERLASAVESKSFAKQQENTAFVLASQSARDTRFASASRQPFAFENVATGFGVARPIYDFAKIQETRARQVAQGSQASQFLGKVTRFTGYDMLAKRQEKEYQAEATAFSTEYRFINPRATDKEIQTAFDRYSRRQLASEAISEASLLGVGVGAEATGRALISGYRTVKALAPVVARAEYSVLGTLSRVPGVGKYVKPATRTLRGGAVRVSRAELTGAVLGSTAVAGAFEGGATYYIQSGTRGTPTTTADALKSVGFGALSAGTISTTQTRLATSSSRFARGRGERLFTGAVNVLDPQEPLSDALTDLTVRSTTSRLPRVRTFLSEPTLTQTRSRYPTYTFTSVRPTSRVQTQTATEALVSSRSSIGPRSETQARTALKSYVGTSTRVSPSISPSTQVTARVPTKVSTRPSVRSRVQVSPKVMTPEFPFLLPPRIGGRGRRGGVLGLTTTQPARFATSLTGSVFGFGGGAGSAQAITGIGSRR